MDIMSSLADSITANNGVLGLRSDALSKSSKQLGDRVMVDVTSAKVFADDYMI